MIFGRRSQLPLKQSRLPQGPRDCRPQVALGEVGDERADCLEETGEVFGQAAAGCQEVAQGDVLFALRGLLHPLARRSSTPKAQRQWSGQRGEVGWSPPRRPYASPNCDQTKNLGEASPQVLRARRCHRQGGGRTRGHRAARLRGGEAHRRDLRHRARDQRSLHR